LTSVGSAVTSVFTRSNSPALIAAMRSGAVDSMMRRFYRDRHAALLGLVQALAYGVYALDEPAYADRIKAFRLK